MAVAKKLKFKDSVALHHALQGDILAGRVAPVYLLMGKESYFIDSLTDLLAENLLPEQERAFNQIVVYGKDSNVGQIINFARQMPMMGGRQVVIIKDAANLKNIDQLSLYTANPSPSTVLVISHKGANIDKRTALYKQCEKVGIVFESVEPYDNEVGPWLEGYIRSKGLQIEPRALVMLTENLGKEITKIMGELDKLLIYLPEGTTRITTDDVERNIGISKDFNVFELLSSFSTGDMRRSLLIGEHLMQNARSLPTGEIFGYFQKVFIINYKHWESKYRGAPVTSDAELAQMLGVHPFFLGEYKQAAARFPNKKVFHIFDLLREYDMRSKGIGTGSADLSELMRELLLKIYMQ